MGYLKYKGYTGTVEYSQEDACLFGQVQGIPGTLISYEGESVEDIKKDFEGAIDDYLQSCEERNIAPAKPYSGILNLRIPTELHAALAQAASSAGTTVNEFIRRSLRAAVY